VYGLVGLVTPNDLGLYRFLINGAPPVGNQAYSLGESGTLIWDESNPNTPSQVRSYAVVATVKNHVSANQNHLVEVDIGCEDNEYTSSDNECWVFFEGGELRVDVFVP